MSATLHASTTAEKAADYLVWLSQEHGDPITNLKLQKLLYYGEGWFLALKGRSLFPEKIEAWVRGPAVHNVWKKYSEYKWRPIAKRITKPSIPADAASHLDEIYAVIGRHSAFTLERATHREPPWRKAREGLDDSESSSDPISRAEMRKYFSSLAHGRAK